jgi:hypothetical protein
MTLPPITEGQLIAALAVLAALLALVLWLVFRRRPTPEEIEQARRQFLVQSGRLVDGMLLDVYEVVTKPRKKHEEPRTLTLLLFNYRIAGVDYECSQDITAMGAVIDAAHVRAGFPCSVRYQPGNPQNSIVIAEDWTGLRAGLPVLPPFEDPDPLDLSHLHHD